MLLTERRGAGHPEAVRRGRRPVPPISYPPELPVSARRDELLAAISDHQVVVVAGETGSGKSTQLPKLCLEAGRGTNGMIGHTQPRRLAARAVAERVAEELGTPLGATVGYTVRFTDRVGEDTLVQVMTDGILLNEIQRDRELRRYDTIIVDEAHERSLNIDFILGYLRQLLPRRPDLKVIVTSATIDTERFSRHFGGAPVVEVSGRTYPVEVRYRPVVDGTNDRDQTDAVCDAVQELCREGPGDILVFLSGEREIRETADALRRMQLPGTELLPLYARLPAADQHRVFAPHRGRRIVLATNVAETSITVPGIRYVVDPGTARISRYSRRTKVQRLPIEAISRASADQRAGRCGRVAPGVCTRLYSEEDYLGRPEFTEPEILRTNLASVILQMAAIGLGDVAAFPFVDPPDARNIRDGVALLTELGALDPTARDGRPRLTPLGRRLARLPLDPRLGRMVLEADRLGCVREVLVVTAALSIQDPRERPAGDRVAAEAHHARFADPDSDFVALLNLWEYLQDRQRELSSNQFRRLCHAEHLHHLRVREWQDIYRQLREVARGMGLRINRQAADRDALHQALLAGLLSHVGLREGEGRDYLGARNARFRLSPGSGLAATPPRWVMAAELVETTRLWAHTNARIRPEWAERLGGHLVKRTYSEPHWDAGRGQAMAHERVTLYGVPLVERRRVGYGRIDPPLARELFIRHALVEGDWVTHHDFADRNRGLIGHLRDLEARARRDLLVDEEALVDFFDERIPAGVVSARHFDRWWRDARRERPALLDYTTEVLVLPGAGRVSPDDFPDEWHQGELTLPLRYEFDPTSPTDGVTVEIPLGVLNRVRAGGFDWQIPGRRHELVTALIRTLPKDLRRSLAPAPDHARAFLDRAGPGDGPLVPTMARVLSNLTGAPVPAGAFRPDRLPGHLRVHFRVIGEDGTVLGEGDDPDALKVALGAHVQAVLAEAAAGIEHPGATAWAFGTIPSVVTVDRDGVTLTGYPALVDEGDRVAVRVLPDEEAQHRSMWAGTRRLLLLTVPSVRRVLRDRLTTRTKLGLAHAPHAGYAELLDDCVGAAADQLLAAHGGPVRDAESFERLRAAVAAELGDRAVGVVAAVGRILEHRRRIEGRLDAVTAPALLPAVADVRAQLDRLVHPGFATATGARRLPDLLRYLRAVEHRLDKLPGNPARDRERQEQVRLLEHELDQLVAAGQLEPGDERRLRRLLDELRVSLFAQHLGTAERVSVARLARELRAAASSVA